MAFLIIQLDLHACLTKFSKMSLDFGLTEFINDVQTERRSLYLNEMLSIQFICFPLNNEKQITTVNKAKRYHYIVKDGIRIEKSEMKW